MARLTAPNGSVVIVDDEYAERLVAEQGYRPDGEKKTATKKAAAPSKTEK